MPRLEVARHGNGHIIHDGVRASRQPSTNEDAARLWRALVVLSVAA